MTGHVLVTGGGSGIGAATVRALAAAGARVTVLDRTGPADWWDAIPEPQRGRWEQLDATDEQALAAAVDRAEGASGLVTCAGMSVKEPFLDTTTETWTSTLALNVVASATAARLLVARLTAERRDGAIVFVSSTGAFGYVNGLGAHYHASKAAVAAMTRALAAELGPQRIRVNAVAPGTVRTPMTAMMRERLGEDAIAAQMPLGTVIEPEQIADAVLFLLGPESSMVTGHVLPVDGGLLSVAGRPLDGFPPRHG